MSIRFAQQRFAPTLFATLLTLVAISGFARLGWWQLERADAKQTLHAQYVAGQQSVVELRDANAAALTRYQRVRARGRYDGTRQILLDNMPSAMGQPGYRVVTPFQLEQGGTLLVDRGWRPMGRSRSEIPDIAVSSEPRAILGQLDALPRPGVRLSDGAAAGAGSWPRVLHFPTQEQLEQALGQRLLPGLVLLDANQPNGYERVWQARFDLGPQRHLAYAVQWFGFAAVAAVLYIVLGLRRGRLLNGRLG